MSAHRLEQNGRISTLLGRPQIGQGLPRPVAANGATFEPVLASEASGCAGSLFLDSSLSSAIFACSVRAV
jgi:hypothetical protein